MDLFNYFKCLKIIEKSNNEIICENLSNIYESMIKNKLHKRGYIHTNTNYSFALLTCYSPCIKSSVFKLNPVLKNNNL